MRFTPKIQHKVSDSSLPVFDVTIHYSCYDEWWRCIYAKLYHMMWLCGNQLHSTVFKGTSNKHWNTEKTASIIKRKMVSSKWHNFVSNSWSQSILTLGSGLYFGVWPQKINKNSMQTEWQSFIIQVTRSTLIWFSWLLKNADCVNIKREINMHSIPKS